MGSYPSVVDWNSDGAHDLLIGDSDGNVRIYLNTGGNTNPVLGEGMFIQANGKNINVGERAAPDYGDYNGDGKKDLIIGDIEGHVIIYLNKGNDSAPVFDSPSLLKVGGNIFDAGSRSAPRIYDWNRDGLKDILLGEMEGYVYFLKNAGTNNAPLFNRAGRLYLGNGDVLRYSSGNPRSRLFVTDWNNDGLDDILLGGTDGRVMLFPASSRTSYSPLVFVKRIFNQSKESFVNIKHKMKMGIKAMKIKG